MNERNTAKTIDAYNRRFPKEVAKRLKAITSMVRKLAPNAEERISYQIPYFALNGRLLYFAAFEHHIGLYSFPASIRKFKKELKGYQTSKGTIRFQHDEKLPLGLIRKIIQFRVQQNMADTKKEKK